jgi:dTMP kinase
LARGVFITFEGGEGAGKTTQAAHLAASLRAAGHEVVLTREPGGTAEAEAIRRLLLDPQLAWTALGELLLVSAARAEHVARLIRPSLDAGKIVICDRFTDSTWAYQGAGRGLDETALACCEGMIGLSPDLTLLLDADPARLAARKGGPADRFERESAAFFARVREGFLARARRFPERIVVIDAEAAEAEVAAAVARAVRARLGILP